METTKSSKMFYNFSHFMFFTIEIIAIPIEIIAITIEIIAITIEIIAITIETIAIHKERSHSQLRA